MSVQYRRDVRNRELEQFAPPEPKRLGNFKKGSKKVVEKVEKGLGEDEI